ncbi:DNA fragmentation factor subunit alpha-like [Anopheles maculipalpis]|uniref:DNA fragmentation factor subunit alpha-like n=1 Tax=Anopheles maculipalpis TaxID=1496333 RepID=UPI002159229C|nr:DNA fragmentation factor subunit alpha-like [Anopheles maculipalpis]
MEEDNKKPYKIKDVTRAIKKAVVAGTLDEVRTKAAEKFGRTDLPNIHLDSDGTEVDDEDYFQTLEPNAELIAVFSGEQWIDPTHYVTITTRRDSADITDSPDVERIHLKKLVAQMKTNLCNVSVLSEPDLELLSNMDPNSVADITGKDFIEQLKEASGRILHEKRKAADAIELLKLIAKQPIASNDADSINREYDDGADDGNARQLRSFLTATTVRSGPIVNQPQRADMTAAAAAEESSSSPSTTTPSTTILSIPATIDSYSDGKHNITVHLQPTVGNCGFESSTGEDTLDTCRKPTDSKPDHGKPI